MSIWKDIRDGSFRTALYDDWDDDEAVSDFGEESIEEFSDFGKNDVQP